MQILVTGGAGFIASNFVRYMLERNPDISIVNFDLLTYAGNLENLADLEKNEHHVFVRGDICSRQDVEALFSEHQFDAVANFAAQTHVDRSLMDVTPFINTNVLGVQILLDACRANGVNRYLQVSTDEVYGSLGATGLFTETSPIKPNNPYSATKASADFLVRAAHESHGLDAVITRCSNNFGPYQFPEKLIPLVIANAMEDKRIPVYGDGMQVRDWIYVIDHCSAVETVLRKGKPGEIYNMGAHKDVPNIEVVKSILSILNKPESLIEHVEDRPGHDRRYAMDSSKIETELGWSAAHTFGNALETTVNWYLDNRDWWERIRTGEYASYYEKLYGNRGKHCS